METHGRCNAFKFSCVMFQGGEQLGMLRIARRALEDVIQRFERVCDAAANDLFGTNRVDEPCGGDSADRSDQHASNSRAEYGESGGTMRSLKQRKNEGCAAGPVRVVDLPQPDAEKKN